MPTSFSIVRCAFPLRRLDDFLLTEAKSGTMWFLSENIPQNTSFALFVDHSRWVKLAAAVHAALWRGPRGIKAPTQQPKRSSGSHADSHVWLCYLGSEFSALNRALNDILIWIIWEAWTTQLASSLVSDAGKLWDTTGFKFGAATFERWCIKQIAPWASATQTSREGCKQKASMSPHFLTSGGPDPRCVKSLTQYLTGRIHQQLLTGKH